MQQRPHQRQLLPHPFGVFAQPPSPISGQAELLEQPASERSAQHRRGSR